MARWTNWAGDQACEPASIERPGTLDALQKTVARLGRAGPSRSRLRLRPLVHGLRPDRGRDDPPRRPHAEARLRPGVGALQGRGGRRAPRPQPHARRRRRRVREPRRHRPPDGRGLDLDRHARDGRAVPERLGAGRGARADRARRLARHDRRVRARSAARRARVASARSGSSTRSRSARFPPTRSTASTRRSRSARCSTSLDELNAGTDHFEFYVFPGTDVALCRESRRTQEPPAPKHPAVVYAQEVMLENWVGQGVRGRRADAPDARADGRASSPRKGLGRATKIDASYRVFASERHIKFTEMEYAVPRERGRELIEGVLEIADAPGAPRRVADRGALRQGRRLLPQPLARAGHLLRRGPPGPQARLGALLPPGRVARPRPRRSPALGQAPLPQSGGPRRRRTRSGTDFQAARKRLDPEGAFANAYTDRVLGPAG